MITSQNTHYKHDLNTIHISYTYTIEREREREGEREREREREREKREVSLVSNRSIRQCEVFYVEKEPV